MHASSKANMPTHGAHQRGHDVHAVHACFQMDSRTPLFHNATLSVCDVHVPVLTFFLCGAGCGRCWWGQPGAAELASQDAQALQQASCQSLHIRWLMPQAMLELITYEPESGQVDSATPDPEANSAQLHTNGKEQQAGGVHCHCQLHGRLHQLVSEQRQL